MGDKTCGMCAHCRWNDRYKALCVYACIPEIEEISFGEECMIYQERTDSVEQVARDAVGLILDPPNYSRYKLMRDAAEGYAERLHALGVDV